MAQNNILGSVPPLPEPVNPARPVDLVAMNRLNSFGLERIRSAVEAKIENVCGFTLPAINPNKHIDVDLAVPAQRVREDSVREKLALEISGIDGVKSAVVAGKFINITIHSGWLLDSISRQLSDHSRMAFATNSGNGRIAILDTSSPNIAKKMHLGHLRSTVIGESLSRILRYQGYTTVRDNHLGDWGVQFGLLAVGLARWESEYSSLLESEIPQDRIEGLLQIYIRVNAIVAKEKESGNDEVSDTLDEARRWFADLENGKEDHKAVWQRILDDSILEFEDVYRLLNVGFEYYIGESYYEPMNKAVVEAFESSGKTYIDERGTMKVNPSKEGADSLSIKTKDGTSLYGTRDIATLVARKSWFKDPLILYVVGNEQAPYFRNVFEAYTTLTGNDADAEFIGAGLIKLPGKKMSTRKGTIVFLRDVYESFFNEAKKVAEEDGLDRDHSSDELAHQVAAGSIVYFDLMGSRLRSIEYRAEEAVRFEGNTGPSLQYTVARMNSIIEQASTMQGDTDLLDIHLGDPEVKVLRLISQFQAVIEEASNKREPSVIAVHLEKIKSGFNSFYESSPVLKAETDELRDIRIQLTIIARDTLRIGLELLNIPSPERM